jgi:hypothetical protein
LREFQLLRHCSSSEKKLGCTIDHIKIGHEELDSGVYKDSIIHHSLQFFFAAFNRGSDEAEIGVVTLRNVDISVIQLFYD